MIRVLRVLEYTYNSFTDALADRMKWSVKEGVHFGSMSVHSSVVSTTSDEATSWKSHVPSVCAPVNPYYENLEHKAPITYEQFVERYFDGTPHRGQELFIRQLLGEGVSPTVSWGRGAGKTHLFRAVRKFMADEMSGQLYEPDDTPNRVYVLAATYQHFRYWCDQHRVRVTGCTEAVWVGGDGARSLMGLEIGRPGDREAFETPPSDEVWDVYRSRQRLGRPRPFDQREWDEAHGRG